MPLFGSQFYGSDNEEVAVVDDNGVIYARRTGTCVINVWDSMSDVSAKFTVTVVEKQEDPEKQDDPEKQEDPEKQDDPEKQEDPEKQDDPEKQAQAVSPTPQGQKTQQQRQADIIRQRTVILFCRHKDNDGDKLSTYAMNTR